VLGARGHGKGSDEEGKRDFLILICEGGGIVLPKKKGVPGWRSAGKRSTCAYRDQQGHAKKRRVRLGVQSGTISRGGTTSGNGIRKTDRGGTAIQRKLFEKKGSEFSKGKRTSLSHRGGHRGFSAQAQIRRRKCVG